MIERVNAFVPGVKLRIEGRADGPLAGLTFASKDLFDVAGYPTGAGNPDWACGRPIPTRHAWAVQTLLDAGATLIGKTITDEVSLGILGENPFHGTPLNSLAPARVPGGSSSGSAAAVAAALCDTALGTDTGGSVRVPASFCGLYGIRPTHGRLPVTGMLPQAPSSDSTGWFARDAATFGRVSAVMLGDRIGAVAPWRLVIATDAFGFADREAAMALEPVLRRLRRCAAVTREDLLAPPGLSVWARAQRTLQRWEAWVTFREWIERVNPRLAFNVARGLISGSMISEAERAWADLMRREARARMAHLLAPGTVVCLPTTPFPAPPKGLPLSVQNAMRDRILCLCAPGGLTGVPQVTLPGTVVNELPIGLSLIGGPGTDAMLVSLALALAEPP